MTLLVTGVDDAPSLDIVPWKLSVPAVRFDLASLKKRYNKPRNIQNSSIYNFSLNTLYQKQFSSTVLKQRNELLRRLYPQNKFKKPFTCRLPDDSSIYTAELRAVLLALKHVYYSKEKSLLILSDSLSSLQSILNLECDHPVLVRF